MTKKSNYPAQGNLVAPGDLWRCPKCGEELTPADLENFQSCPYCDCRFVRDETLEDYVLSPIVRQWVEHVRWRD